MRERIRKISAILLIVALVASMTGCGGGEKAPTEAEMINIGTIYNLTGGQASLDQPSYNGFKMAADEINAAGGINGKMINVVSYDGKTEQTTVASNVKKMIDVDKCIVVAGLSDSNYALAAGAIAQEKGIPFITSGATLPTLPEQVGDFAFLAPFGDNIQAYATADFALNDLSAKKAYLLIDQSMEFTKTLAFFFEERYKANGGEIGMSLAISLAAARTRLARSSPSVPAATSSTAWTS